LGNTTNPPRGIVCWNPERNRQIILAVIQMSGEDRCVFAGNFPVDSPVGGLAAIYLGFSEATKTLGEAVQAKLFADSARRICRLTEQ